MQTEKVQVAYRISVEFYNRMAKNAERKGMTVPQYTRYILKKYFNDHDKKISTNP
jgi:predicted DNA-binding protein